MTGLLALVVVAGLSWAALLIVDGFHLWRGAPAPAVANRSAEQVIHLPCRAPDVPL